MEISLVEIEEVNGSLRVSYRDIDGDRNLKELIPCVGYTSGWLYYPRSLSKEDALKVLKDALINENIEEIEKHNKNINLISKI